MEVDILTIAAHPDDVEITCGGTVIKMTEAGYRVGILDLTAGESGTRGSAALREKEARRAAAVLGVVHRENLNIPDAGVENNRENKLKVAQKIRDLKPHTVILPYWKGRHPDHYTTGHLGYEACFLAGLAKLPLAGNPTGRLRSSTPRNTCPPFGRRSSWTSHRSSRRSSKPFSVSPPSFPRLRNCRTSSPHAPTSTRAWARKRAISAI